MALGGRLHRNVERALSSGLELLRPMSDKWKTFAAEWNLTGERNETDYRKHYDVLCSLREKREKFLTLEGHSANAIELQAKIERLKEFTRMRAKTDLYFLAKYFLWPTN